MRELGGGELGCRGPQASRWVVAGLPGGRPSRQVALLVCTQVQGQPGGPGSWGSWGTWGWEPGGGRASPRGQVLTGGAGEEICQLGMASSTGWGCRGQGWGSCRSLPGCLFWDPGILQAGKSLRCLQPSDDKLGCGVEAAQERGVSASPAEEDWVPAGQGTP